MRILHVASQLDGPARRALGQLVDGQRRDGHTVTWIDLDAGISEVATSPGEALLATAWARPADIVHVHALPAMMAMALRIRGSQPRRPLVVTAHEWAGESGRRPSDAELDALATAGRIIVPAATGAARLSSRDLDAQRIRVIPYPVEPAPDPDAAAEPFIQEMVDWRNRGGDVVCAVAHRGSGTHHRMVLEALSTIPHREATMCVLAGAVNEALSARHARQLGIEGQLRFSPAESDARVVASRADVVILPGFDERRPCALAEVWCDGVPVVAARNPSFAALDAQGGGTLFYDPGDSLDLARAISTVRGTTPAGRRLLVDRARTLYRLRFTIQAVIAAHMTEYEALLVPAA
jgi:glycosyltransferase involved in cell wall biosynthesis